MKIAKYVATSVLVSGLLATGFAFSGGGAMVGELAAEAAIATGVVVGSRVVGTIPYKRGVAGSNPAVPTIDDLAYLQVTPGRTLLSML
jgi:hypothetical protein